MHSFITCSFQDMLTNFYWNRLIFDRYIVGTFFETKCSTLDCLRHRRSYVGSDMYSRHQTKQQDHTHGVSMSHGVPIYLPTCTILKRLDNLANDFIQKSSSRKSNLLPMSMHIPNPMPYYYVSMSVLLITKDTNELQTFFSIVAMWVKSVQKTGDAGYKLWAKRVL